MGAGSLQVTFGTFWINARRIPPCTYVVVVRQSGPKVVHHLTTSNPRTLVALVHGRVPAQVAAKSRPSQRPIPRDLFTLSGMAKLQLYFIP